MDRSNPWALGAPNVVGLSGRKKKREGLKKHQGKVREVSKYVQVFCSLFFYDERFKAWRLVDWQCVSQGQGKAGQ